MNPRKPTQEEKDQLVQYLWLKNYVDPTDADKEEQQGFVENAAISVFDHYTTDSPGYQGKLMVVVWGGSPTLCQVYIWNREEIEEIRIEQ